MARSSWRGEGVGARPPGIRTDRASTPSTRSAKRSCTTPTRAESRVARSRVDCWLGSEWSCRTSAPAIAQLAFLHVSHDFRASGVGGRLSADLELVARRAGDTEIVVSATPSENTVRFYLGRGYRPMARPLPELFELELEDVHMGKVI
jgi:GNAT superfamily N-acetyltransferase